MKSFIGTKPRTLTEAIEILESCLEEDDRKEILGNDIDTLVANSHFGLGLQIRNAWIYPGIIDISSFPEEEQMFFIFDADNASQFITEQFYKKVKGE